MEYEMCDEMIGEGNFSSVFMGKMNDNKVAIKIIKPHFKIKYEDVMKEYNIVKNMSHPNLIKTFGMDEKDIASIKIILEYCELGTLQDLIENQTLDEKSYIRQILRGLEHLHKNNVIHRDIKPQNILATKIDGKVILKISDFGMSKVLEEKVLTATMCGTMLYMAPEMFKRGRYTNKVDVWAAGCIFYQILFGVHPFNTNDRYELMKMVMKGHYNIPKVDKNTRELVISTLNVNSENRLECGKLLDLMYFKKKRDKFQASRSEPIKINIPVKISREIVSVPTVKGKFHRMIQRTNKELIELLIVNNSDGEIKRPDFPAEEPDDDFVFVGF